MELQESSCLHKEVRAQNVAASVPPHLKPMVIDLIVQIMLTAIPFMDIIS